MVALDLAGMAGTAIAKGWEGCREMEGLEMSPKCERR